MRLHLIGSIVLLVVLGGKLNSQVGKDTFAIRGNVVDAVTGRPMERAEVSIATIEHLDKPVQELLSGNDGSFSFSGLRPGKYLLVGRKSGFNEQSYEQHGSFASAIVVGPGLTSDHVIFRLHPDSVIGGKITDSENEAVTNATVLLFRRDANSGFMHTSQVAQTMSDDRGYYHFGHLGSGRYFVVVSAQPWYSSIAASLHESPEYDPIAADSLHLDMVYPATYYPGVTDSSSASPIVLNENQNIIADLVLVPTPALRITINHADSFSSGVSLKQSIFGTLVDAASTEHAPVGDTVEISGIASGTYILELDSRSASAALHGRVVELGEDAIIDANSSAVLPAVRGKIQIEGELNLDPQAFVRLWNSRTGGAVDTALAANGEFSFNQDFVIPGTYSVFLINGESLMVGTISATGAKVIGQSIQVNGSTPVYLSIRLSHTLSTITGIARRKGKPFPGAMIILVPEDADSNWPLFRRDQSDSDGSFTLRDILPGKYKLIAIENGWNLEWADPAVLKTHLDHAIDTEIHPNTKSEITVEVQ
jgi:hypothetical protein